MWELKPHVDELFGRATAGVEGQLLPGRFAVSPSYQSWIVGQSQEASERVVRHLNAQMRRHREWARQDTRREEPRASAWPAPRGEQEQRDATRRNGPLRCEEVNFSVYDFSTLFPSLDHAVVRKAKTLVSRIYGEQAKKLKVRVAFLRVERQKERRGAPAASGGWQSEVGTQEASSTSASARSRYYSTTYSTARTSPSETRSTGSASACR